VARQVFVDSHPPASVIHALMDRQVQLTAKELRAGAPAVPLTPDPSRGSLPNPAADHDSAVLPAVPARSVAHRRVRRTR
jgi:hypothetical protein